MVTSQIRGGLREKNKRLEASGQCAATENALCEYDSNGICDGDCYDQDGNGVCDKYNNLLHAMQE